MVKKATTTTKPKQQKSNEEPPLERFLERLIRLEIRLEEVEKKLAYNAINPSFPPQKEELEEREDDIFEAIDNQTKEMIKELTKNLSVLSGLDPEQIAPFDFNFKGELETDLDIEETSVEGVENIR